MLTRKITLNKIKYYLFAAWSVMKGAIEIKSVMDIFKEILVFVKFFLMK